ncbi:hypothetical protein LIER_19886 [Lithospermum erythrorhizon]|uniref:Uncharacterized protein n=1 Tax=Lithospermum erythrorhizon TaxID=34254 RepID=A0AAV3QKX9_LITER
MEDFTRLWLRLIWFIESFPMRLFNVCVALDVSKPLMKQIWVKFEDDNDPFVVEGFWQLVEYDTPPMYYDECQHLGHSKDGCK